MGLKDKARAKEERRAAKKSNPRAEKGPEIAWDEAVHEIDSSIESVPGPAAGAAGAAGAPAAAAAAIAAPMAPSANSANGATTAPVNGAGVNRPRR